MVGKAMDKLVSLKTLEELGVPPLHYAATGQECKVFVRPVIGAIHIGTDAKGRETRRTLISEQYTTVLGGTTPAVPVLQVLAALLHLLENRPDMRAVLLHQVKAQVEHWCELEPLPEGIGPVAELVNWFPAKEQTG